MRSLTTLTITTAAGLTAMATAAGASTMTLDNYDIASGPVISSNDVPETTENAADSAIGDFREIIVLGDGTPPDGTTGAVNNGELTFSNDAGVQGRIDVIYNGPDSAGLGGVDLTMGDTHEYFAFDLTTDVPIGYEISVEDTSSNSATSTYTVSDAFLADETIMVWFSEFAGVDLTNANSVTLSFVDPSDNFAADVTVDNFRTGTTAVPLPASALLMLGGLGAFGFARKRRG